MWLPKKNELPLIAVNDNEPPCTNTIRFTELAYILQLDEDVLLQRIAVILNKRATTN